MNKQNPKKKKKKKKLTSLHLLNFNNEEEIIESEEEDGDDLNKHTSNPDKISRQDRFPPPATSPFASGSKLVPIEIVPFHGNRNDRNNLNRSNSGDVPGSREFLIDRSEEALDHAMSIPFSKDNQEYEEVDIEPKIEPAVNRSPKPASRMRMSARNHRNQTNRPSTTSGTSNSSNSLLLPRLEPQKQEYQRPSTTQSHSTLSNPGRRRNNTRSNRSASFAGTGTPPSVAKKKSLLLKRNNTKRRKNSITRRPNTAPDPSRRKGRKGYIGTMSGMLIDRPSPTASQRKKRPQTSVGSPVRRKQHLNSNTSNTANTSNTLKLRKEDLHRYKRILHTDIFTSRTKMLSKRLDLTFRAKGPHFNLGTLIPIVEEIDQDTPRLLATLHELHDLIGMSSSVASQFIEVGLVPLISSAAWLFGTVEKSVERRISEIASELLRDLCKLPGHATLLITRTDVVSTLGAIILSGIGKTWSNRRLEKNNKKKNKNKNQNMNEKEEEKDTTDKDLDQKDDLHFGNSIHPKDYIDYDDDNDLAAAMRQTSAWSSLRPYVPSYTDQYLPTDFQKPSITTKLQHTSRQVWMAVQSLGALSSKAEQYFLQSGDGEGWNRFIQDGGLEYLILAGSDGSFPTDTIPLGKLNAMCSEWLDTGKCTRHQCPFMHITGVYSTLTGVTTVGDVYVPETAFPSAQLERVRLSHHILRTQFNVHDFINLNIVRKERIENDTKAAINTLSIRATLLYDQVSLQDPSAFLSSIKFGTSSPNKYRNVARNASTLSTSPPPLVPHSPPLRSPPRNINDPYINKMPKFLVAQITRDNDDESSSSTKDAYVSSNPLSPMLISTVGSPITSPLLLSTSPISTHPQQLQLQQQPQQRNKGKDTESLLSLHMQRALVGNSIIRVTVPHTLRQHLEWLRRAKERERRLAIEAEEWRIIRQQRIAQRIHRMCDLVRRAARRDPHEERLVGELLKVFTISCLKFVACPQRANAEVTRSSSSKSRSSSRTDQPHNWTRSTSKGPAQCHHCHEIAATLALTSTDSHRNFLTATALGLRFKRWLSDVPLAFVRMNLPQLHTNWINNCQQNNSKDCGIAGYRLAKHPYFIKYCGNMMRAPKSMNLNDSDIECIDIILVGSPIRKLSGSKEVQRKKILQLPRGVDPSRVGWPGLSLQG